MRNKKAIFELFGQNVKNVRIQKGWTIKKLALKTGIREQYLLKIENGTAFGITTTKFFKIAEALEVQPSVLAKGI